MRSNTVNHRLNLKSFLFLLLFAPCAALAGEGLDRLHRQVDAIQTLKARFYQVVTDENGQVKQESDGWVYLARPGRFHWHYRSPFEQRIIADGERLWIYDPDLEQVTIKSLGNALETAPFWLLSGSGSVTDSYRVLELGDVYGREWLRLDPYAEESQFTRIYLALGAERIEVMELKDNFEQTTRIELIEAEINNKIDESLFNFQIPNGVDVIGEHDAL